MNEIKVIVDKRTECMSALLYISNYRKEFPELITHNRDVSYVNDIHETFTKFSNHRAVLLLNEIIEKLNFCYDVPYLLATQLNDDFSVGELLEYPFRSRLNSSPIVLEFLNEIKDFAEKSEFEKFYEAHKESYQENADKTCSLINFELLSKFEEFFKMNTKIKYVVNFLPLENRKGCYYDKHKVCTIFIRNNIEDEDITYQIFSVLSLCLLRNMVEENNLNVPLSNNFAKILKVKYTPINNIQYICGKISEILKIVFQKNVSKFDDDEINEALLSCEIEEGEKVFKIYDILQEWQKSDAKLEKYLQQILDLF